MLGDSKAEVARLAEVPPDELKLLHLESRLQELQRLISSHSHMTRDLLVTSDREGSHCVPCLGEDRLLTCCCYCCHTHTHTERESVFMCAWFPKEEDTAQSISLATCYTHAFHLSCRVCTLLHTRMHMCTYTH